MKHLIISLLFLLSFNAMAAAPTLNDLSGAQVEGVFNDLSASMVHSAVTTGSDYGLVFGFEVGLVGGVTDAGTIDTVAPEDVSKLPSFGLMAGASAPFGLGAELIYLPLEVGDFEYSYMSFAGFWVITDVIDAIPFFNLKLKYAITNGDISWKQTVSGVDSTVSYENKSTEISLTISKRILIVEPYAGIGMIESENTLSATGSTTLFGAGVSASETTGKKIDDTHVYLGANAYFLFFTVGAEYGKLYDNSYVRGKLSFGF